MKCSIITAILCASVTNAKLLNGLQAGLKKFVLPAVVGTGLMFNPMDADAASSGGRSGGSSFRSSTPMRSSTRLNSGPSAGYSSRSYGGPTIMPIMPMYSPFGYGGFGFNPFGFIPINFNLLILGGIAYVVYTTLTNRAGGSDFSGSDEDYGSLGTGATVMKLQVCLDSNWDSGNIQETLGALADKNAALRSRSDIASLLSEASMALLRRQTAWDSAAYESKTFRQKTEAEPFYQRMAVAERSKFEVETTGSQFATIKSSNYGRDVTTKTVVSIVVAMRGKTGASSSVRSITDVRSVLQTLASDALTDEGENVMAVEVLWTPSEKNAVLSDREVIEDYPELVKL